MSLNPNEPAPSCIADEEAEADAIGIEDYGYPEIDILGSEVRITLGWFFIDDEDGEEPATYIQQYIDDTGKQRFVVNVYFNFQFDFVTKLKDYGYWVHPYGHDFEYGAKSYFVYLDHHIPLRSKAHHFIKNLPFRTKKKLYYWACSHVPYYRRFSMWNYQRKTEKLFRVKETTK